MEIEKYVLFIFILDWKYLSILIDIPFTVLRKCERKEKLKI